MYRMTQPDGKLCKQNHLHRSSERLLCKLLAQSETGRRVW